MKMFLIFIILLFIISCDISDYKNEMGKKEKIMEIENNFTGHYTIYTVIYDSCEYVVSTNYHGMGITHKGNCKFCKERKNQ